MSLEMNAKRMQKTGDWSWKEFAEKMEYAKNWPCMETLIKIIL